MNARFLWAIVLIHTAAFMIFMYGQIDYTREMFAGWDLWSYQKIAAASPVLATDVPGPFAYRILGPYIVGLLPLPDTTAFYVCTVVLSLVLVLLFYYFLCYMGLDPAASALTVILFSFNKYLFGFNVWDYFQVDDLLTLIFVVILWLAMLKENWIVFGLTLFLGALTREPSMLMVPVAFVYLWERGRLLKNWMAFTASVVPGIAAFFLLRAMVSVQGVFPVQGEYTLFQALLRHSVKMADLEVWARLLGNSFIPLSLLPIVFIEDTASYFKENIHAALFLVLVFISTFWGFDNERLMAPAFLVFYLLIGKLIQRYQEKKLLIIVIVSASFISSFHHVIARYPLPSIKLTIFLSLATLAVVTVAALILRATQSGGAWRSRWKSGKL